MAVPMKTYHALISGELYDIVANSCLLSMAVNWIVIYNNSDIVMKIEKAMIVLEQLMNYFIDIDSILIGALERWGKLKFRS